MSFLDLLISKIAPHECVGCGIEGYLLCVACGSQLVPLPEHCYRCLKGSQDYLTCVGCLPASQLHRVRVAAVYKGSAKQLIWRLKLAGARAAAHTMVKHMAFMIKQDVQRPLIIPVPTATSRARQRGYDQAKLLARELARQTRLPYLDCMSRTGQTHQHGLPRHTRLAQLNAAFRVRRPKAIAGADILLVDDVLTTGATLEAAAATLRAAGANRIEAVVFARPQTRHV
jgi:ComF family protein